MSSQNDSEFLDEAEDAADPQLTELVAYLDGELSDGDSSRVERQLAIDAPLRRYADTLDRTWQLLDSLGETTASGEFTQKTLASLNAVLPDDDSAADASQSWSSLFAGIPIVKICLWMAVGFAGSSAGLLLSRTTSPQKSESEDKRLLRQLDLLQDYEKLYSIPSAEFLKQVAAKDEPTAEKAPTP